MDRFKSFILVISFIPVLGGVTQCLCAWPAWTDFGKESAEAAETAREVVLLRERIVQLEAQNQAILNQLEALSARLDNHSPPLPSSPAVAAKASRAASTASPTAQRLEAAVWAEGNKSRLDFYGFLRVDAIIDDSRPDTFQFPSFILSEGQASGLGNQSNLSFHPRLTRLGINYRGPQMDGLAGARIGGKIEWDFQNGGRESRAIARYRHAYLKLDWEKSSLLLGQSWDLISPLYPAVNADSMMWNAGNLGDRRVQARYAYQPPQGFNFALAAGLTGAVSPQDLDGDGVRDGEASTLPNLQARVGYKSGSGRVKLGFWSHYGQEQTSLASFNGNKDFDSYSVGADYLFELHERLALRGELWLGANLNDFRGGIGQGVNTALGEEIESRGGWIELGVQVRPRYKFSTGFSSDDPKNRDILPGGRTENRVWYLVNQLRLAPTFMIGLDYLYWRTDYRGLEEGTDNRFNLYFIYNF